MSTGEPKHRILVIEDEAMVSMLIEDMVLDCGCEVIGPVAKFDRALEVAREGQFDIAVLDLNLGGTLSYPVAEVIRGRGIPLIFATGYGTAGLRNTFRGCTTLQKPFSQSDFTEAVAAASDLTRMMKEDFHEFAGRAGRQG